MDIPCKQYTGQGDYCLLVRCKTGLTMRPITEKELRQLAEYIKLNFGVNLLQKKNLIEGRLRNYLIKNNFTSFSEYYEHVIADKTGRALIDLMNKLTTNHTFFMRESKHFEYFEMNILPMLISEEQRSKDLRIWSAGCSSGEEPYTLAMIIKEFLGKEKKLWDTRILATDISTKVLEQAVKGIYSNDELTTLPPRWRLNYFRKIDNKNSIIDDGLKKEVIFRKFNLMSPSFPFKRQFHVIFCRNVMIYFDTKTRKDLVDKLYEFTMPGGYLFIGHSESLTRSETKFKYVMPAVYRKD